MAISLEVREGGKMNQTVLKTEVLKDGAKIDKLLIPVASMEARSTRDEEGNLARASLETNGKDPSVKQIRSFGYEDYVVEGYAQVKDGQLQLIHNKKAKGTKRGEVVEMGDEVVAQFTDGQGFPNEVLVFIEGIKGKVVAREHPAVFKSDIPKTEKEGLSKDFFGKRVPLSHQRRFSSRPR